MSDPGYPFLFTSRLIGRSAEDASGQRVGRIVDLVASTGEMYPAVNGLLVQIDRREQRVFPVPIEQLKELNGRGSVRVEREDAREVRLAPNEFLVRDLLLDQQIVDVQGAKVERVNDVQLLLTERAWIVHVDVGLTGLFRRLGFERVLLILGRAVRRPLRDELISWKFVQPLVESGDPGQPIRLKVDQARIHDLHPGEVADILEELGRDERAMILHTLGPEAAADALEEAEDEVQAAVISQLDPEMAADILEEMDPGEAADILTNISDAQSEEIIAEVEEDERAQLEQLISYEEKTAAALMTPEYVAVRPETTVAEALEEVRRQASEIEGIYYLYVLGDRKTLLGVTTLRTLFRSQPGDRIGEIMETRLVTVSPEEEPKAVAEVFQKYSFLGCPVVDEEMRMMGVILIKHAFDELLPEFKREGRQ